MSEEDKQLLLIDLSARLHYGVKVYSGQDFAMTLREIDYKCFCECWENEDFKCHSRWMLPYLRPMSSMTDEEKKELNNILEFQYYSSDSCMCESTDWLNAHHFDYRGLIEKGLAIEVTKENNPYKN